ncbi:MAG: flagellar basal-body rod protein FlgG [Gammaproteobacteria bacterium]|nr:flagellar basal-body rod protein FlgG [Gammaproteobacteria bacterium]MDH5800642.1 flagellar basal-body rod protein FlgG [Gammaproteobacteria bacterium]
MSDSLYVAATGMQAQQTQIDVISNNLANVNTAGFKKSRVDFQDLMYRQLNPAFNSLEALASSNGVGLGTAVSSTSKDFSVGEMKKTEKLLDIAIDGKGFYEVVLPDSSYAYTRGGSFSVNEEGFLVSTNGYLVNPMIQLPSDMESLLIEPNGEVKVKMPGQERLVDLGQIELGQFVNDTGLKALGENLYLPTEQSGEPMYYKPGESGAGLLRQGYVEASNVKLVEELTNMILAQRAYEINSKVIQASDEMLGIVNNLRR